MPDTVSKSKFKPKALHYFRQVEETRKELIVTDHGRPVVRILPYMEIPAAVFQELHASVLAYEDPCEPVDIEDWEALK
jgi:prevent-host-death family protein